MAQLQYSAAPDVAAQSAAPDDTQNIQTSPNAFGAGLADAAVGLGEGIQKTVKFYNNVAADQAINNTMAEHTSLFYGDPSKTVTGPDGQQVADTGYLGLKGQAAMDARVPTATAMDDIIRRNRESLKTPEAQLEYDNQTRRMRANWQEKMGAHADQAQQVWSVSVQDGRIGQAKAQLALHPLDPANVAAVKDMWLGAAVNKAQFLGQDPNKAVTDASGELWQTQAEVLRDQGDGIAARQVLHDHMDVLAGRPGTYQLQNEANAKAQDQLVGTFSDPSAAAAGRAAGAVAPSGAQAQDYSAVPFSQVKDKIIAKEGPVAVGGYNAQAYNVAGAANEVGLKPQNLTSMTIGQVLAYQGDVDNPAPGTMRAATKGKRGPNDVGSTGVGAYQFEHDTLAQNAAATLGADWKNQPFSAANQDKIAEHLYDTVKGDPAKLGKTWAAFSGQGGAGSPGDDGTSSYLDHVRQQAEGVFGRGSIEVENVVKRVEFNMKRDDSAQVAKTHDAVTDVVSYLQDGGDPSKVTMTPDQVRQMVPGQRGADMANDLQAAQEYSTAVNSLKTASQDQVQQILTDHAPNGSQDYREKSAYFGALYKAAQARQEMLFGSGSKPADPAGYVHQAFPDVKQAFDAAMAGGTPQAFSNYVTKMGGAYGALGVPLANRAVLPATIAKSVIGNLQTAQPTEALKSITAFQKEAGSYWPQVYRDLVRSGLPTTFQTPLVVGQTSPQNATTMVAAIQKDADAKAHGKPIMEDVVKGMEINGKSATTLLDTALRADPGMSSLQQTFGVAGRAGVDQFEGVRQSVRQTALYLFATGQEHDPVAAAQKAAKMVTGIYDFAAQGDHPPARLPAGTMSDFRQATQNVLEGLKPDAIRPYARETGTDGNLLQRSPEQYAADALQGARNAYWVTVPGADGQGAVRAIDPTSGHPVMQRNGTPLDIPFAKMKIIAAKPRPGGSLVENRGMLGGFN